MTAEITLSMVLVVGAILLLESFWRLQKIDPGFRTDHLLTMQVWLPTTRYAEPSSVTTFYDQVLRRIEALPGVEAAGAVSFRPFNGMGVATTLDIEGRTRSSFDDFFVPYRVVAPRHTQMLGQPLVRGRDIVDSDVAESEGVTVINQAMAQRFWPNEDPIGKHIRPDFDKRQTPWDVNGPPRWLTIVGVVSNIKENRLNEQPPPEFYVSYRQFPSSFMFLMVRTTGPPEKLAPSIQEAVRDVDPDEAIANVRTMDDAIDSVAPRFNVQLLVAFAAIAMALSAVGVYGVTSYAIGQRTQEIALRMAIGARAADVLTMIIREIFNLAVAGIVVGAASAFVLTRAMATLLYGISRSDFTTYAAASIAIFVVMLLACYIPARRATKVDPIGALKT